MGSAERCVRLRIEGRVQGVGFRAWVERTASGLGLDGWVRNRRDGGVEVVVAGTSTAVEHMIVQCRRGPPAARVDTVKILDEPDCASAGFAVRPTV